MKYGVFPLDFIVESVIKAGIDWFRSDPAAANLVFGQLDQPYLARYGTEKIAQLKEYLRVTDIKVVQNLAMVDGVMPHISIQLSNGMEDTSKASLDDALYDRAHYDGDGMLLESEEVGYSPISEQILIGLHAGETPDLPKYMYMLVIYVLNAYKYDLESKGVYLGTFNMTDISRLNEYLPENIFSRFVNFTAVTNAVWQKGKLPNLDVILDPSFSNADATEETKVE